MLNDSDTYIENEKFYYCESPTALGTTDQRRKSYHRLAVETVSSWDKGRALVPRNRYHRYVADEAEVR